VSYDGEHFSFNQVKVKEPGLKSIFENTVFTGDETPPSCLTGHFYETERIGVTDTRSLWKTSVGPKCRDKKCPKEKFYKKHFNGHCVLLFEQEYLICSGDEQGWTGTGPRTKVRMASEAIRKDRYLESDSDSDALLGDMFET